ncbi:MAG: hypothetical protein CMF52_03305 [Legionellales bacterium]|nr:hypothetical protein [Legionellales bacterium]
MPTNLAPKSTTSAIILTSTGSADNVSSAVPFGIYTGSVDFLSGASLQVNYVYKKLGGDVVDIELTPANVYAAYEEAVLEYSYIINLHQSKNSLGDSLGDVTGTFDHKGEIKSGSATNLKFPRFQVAYSQKIGDGLASMGNFGGTRTIYSASFNPVKNIQDYDLQNIVQSASAAGVDHAGRSVDFDINGKRIFVTKVFYKSPRAMWRFYGYYGGIGVVGNMSTYGQFADDSTFELIPTWQNKMQAVMYEDSIFTRTSHYSYEIKNNKLRLFPTPSFFGFQDDTIWFQFYVKEDATATNSAYEDGVNGVNNLNTLPFSNIPYENINSMGKQWIRKYSLALCKEMLGQIRGKFTQIPIPGESVTLNHSELLSQAKDEQQQLKDKLMEMLKETEYQELARMSSEKAESAAKTFAFSPLPIFVG